MPFTIPCPTCHVRFSVEESSLGQSAQCPECGNVFTAASAEAIVAGNPSPASSTPAGNEQKMQASGDHWAWMVPGVLAIVAFGALAWMKMRYHHTDWHLPLVWSFIVATPASVRTLLVAFRKMKQSVAASPLSIVGTFLSSLGMAVMIGLVGLITFLASLFVAIMLEFIPFDVSGTGGVGRKPESPLVWIVIFGLVLAVIIWPLRKFFAKKG